MQLFIFHTNVILILIHAVFKGLWLIISLLLTGQQLFVNRKEE